MVKASAESAFLCFPLENAKFKNSYGMAQALLKEKSTQDLPPFLHAYKFSLFIF